MNVICVDCQRQWARPCPECADEIADKHRDNYPEHTVHVTGVDETQRGAIIDLPNNPFPQWMRGNTK